MIVTKLDIEQKSVSAMAELTKDEKRQLAEWKKNNPDQARQVDQYIQERPATRGSTHMDDGVRQQLYQAGIFKVPPKPSQTNSILLGMTLIGLLVFMISQMFSRSSDNSATQADLNAFSNTVTLIDLSHNQEESKHTKYGIKYPLVLEPKFAKAMGIQSITIDEEYDPDNESFRLKIEGTNQSYGHKVIASSNGKNQLPIENRNEDTQNYIVQEDLRYPAEEETTRVKFSFTSAIGDECDCEATVEKEGGEITYELYCERYLGDRRAFNPILQYERH